MKKKVAVIGGGAAGLMAAFAAAKNGNDVTVFEKKHPPCQKGYDNRQGQVQCYK